jgi:hypothetical protein
MRKEHLPVIDRNLADDRKSVRFCTVLPKRMLRHIHRVCKSTKITSSPARHHVHLKNEYQVQGYFPAAVVQYPVITPRS